jgi:metallophosphoesterase superfamily enzyme
VIKLINDIHADPQRVGGTTDKSREALQQYAIDQFGILLDKCGGADKLVILGDLFNKAQVSNWAFLQVYALLNRFCNENPATELIIVRGNHDSKSKDIQSLCSLEMIGSLLGGRAQLIFHGPTYFEDEGCSHMVIPHVFDQSQFDAVLDSVDSTIDYVHVHANIDNNFATGDHSLNVSKEQVLALADKGVIIVCGHEHQPREPFPNVVVVGNQFPTSVADCKGNGQKSMLVIEGRSSKRIVTWTDEKFWDGSYTELANVPEDAQFIRVYGEATKDEFPAINQAIGQLRKQSDAFVVSNAVKAISEDVTVSAEDIVNIDVVAQLIEALPEQFKLRVLSCVPEE